MRGWHHSSEAKRKISETRIRKHLHPPDPPWNKGLTAASDERIKKVAQGKRSQVPWCKGLTKETDVRLESTSLKMIGNRNAFGKRWKQSAETVAKRVMKLRGRFVSKETRRNMSESHKGKKQSPESIAKRALALTGKKRSDESKRKLSEANKGQVLKPRRRMPKAPWLPRSRRKGTEETEDSNSIQAVWASMGYLPKKASP